VVSSSNEEKVHQKHKGNAHEWSWSSDEDEEPKKRDKGQPDSWIESMDNFNADETRDYEQVNMEQELDGTVTPVQL
jgi:hypothetical protein